MRSFKREKGVKLSEFLDEMTPPKSKYARSVHTPIPIARMDLLSTEYSPRRVQSEKRSNSWLSALEKQSIVVSPYQKRAKSRCAKGPLQTQFQSLVNLRQATTLVAQRERAQRKYGVQTSINQNLFATTTKNTS